MDNSTREVLQSYIKEEIPDAVRHTLSDTELVPVLLMVLGSKLDTLIKLAEGRRSDN
jgi:hypothetical protein